MSDEPNIMDQIKEMQGGMMEGGDEPVEPAPTPTPTPTETPTEPEPEPKPEPQAAKETPAEPTPEPPATPAPAEPEGEVIEGEPPKMDFRSMYLDLLRTMPGGAPPPVQELQPQPVEQPPVQEPQKAPQPQYPQYPQAPQDAPFITEEEHNAMLADPDVLNNVLKNLYMRARDEIHKEILRGIPSVVSSSVSQQISTERRISDMYRKNDWLLGHEGLVAQVGQMLFTESGGTKKLEQIIEEIPEEVEKRYKLRTIITQMQGTQQPSAAQPRKPAFVQRPTTPPKPTPGDVDEIAKQIAAMRLTSGFED